IEKLNDGLLNHTQTVKDYEVSIRQLEKRMNVEAALMESKNWEVKKSLFNETSEGILLNKNGSRSEELEEA
ncbi:hypothetical protein HAX54_017514, partial [Datura stramonium]|nr:hypothetical protein [Datura stramonium]